MEGLENIGQKTSRGDEGWRVYRTSGVIFFIDYCTAIRDTQKGQ
jgi:hypothetical protein